MGLMGGLYTLLKQKGFKMKIFDTIAIALKAIKKSLVEHKDKALVALGLASTTVGTTGAHAAVTFAEATGFSGSLELLFFYSAVGVIVVALCAMWAVKSGVKLFSRG